MATITTRTVVCDGKHATPEPNGLVTVQLSVDGRRAKKVYCPRHAAPYLKLLEEMGGGTAGGDRTRGKVYTTEEIAAKKRASKKT